MHLHTTIVGLKYTGEISKMCKDGMRY